MIKLKHIVLIGLIASLSFSCNSHQRSKKKVKNSGTISKSSVNYYYDQNINDNEKSVPLILIIDPHGDGKLAVEKFKKVSDKHQCLLIGLINVKNNTPNFDNFIYKAINDAVQNFPVDKNKIYLAGFSGGARMSFQYALNYGCSGLIMCGAGPGNIGNKNIPFPLVMISGTRDFNFVEQYYSPFSNAIQNSNMIALHFKGKHEWPSEDLISQAFEFITKNKQAEVPDLNTFIKNSELLESSGNYLLSFKQLELAFKISDVSARKEISQALNNLISKTEFKNYFKNLEQELSNEMQRNQNYVQNIDSKNLDWWKNEIQKIETNINDTTLIVKSDSYARTKAFLGILLFSKTNSLIHQKNNNKLLNKTLTIYELIEPENPDVYYYKSLNNFLNKDTLNCVKNITKAFDLGFKDNLKMKKDFPPDIIKLFK